MRELARKRLRTRRSGTARDQHESAFAQILGDLVPRVPGARAAALVDAQGETVDYAGGTTPYDLRVAAAHLRIVLFTAQAQSTLVGVRWCAVRASLGSYLVYALPEGYALVLVFARGGGLVGWHRAVAACNRALANEAGWAGVDTWCEPWFAVEVVPDANRRPRSIKISGRVRSVEIVGALANGRRATPSASAAPTRGRAGTGALAAIPPLRGWRVRLDTGAEATLIREPGGTWYSDEPLEGVLGPLPRHKPRG